MEQKQDADVLFFFSKSADAVPGKGIHECVHDTHAYKELSSIQDWRKILSNFYVAPFRWRGKTWKTAEHAFQSRKIELVNECKADWFTLESGHEIGQGNGSVARKHRKLVLLEDTTLQYWRQINADVMKEIWYCKFSQIELCQRVLLETGNARLLHSFGRGRRPERLWGLEQVRDILRDHASSMLHKEK